MLSLDRLSEMIVENVKIKSFFDYLVNLPFLELDFVKFSEQIYQTGEEYNKL